MTTNNFEKPDNNKGEIKDTEKKIEYSSILSKEQTDKILENKKRDAEYKDNKFKIDEGLKKLLVGVEYSDEEMKIIQESLKDIKDLTPEEIEKIPVLGEIADQYIENIGDKLELDFSNNIDFNPDNLKDIDLEKFEDEDEKITSTKVKKTISKEIVIASLAALLTGCIGPGYNYPTTPGGSILGATIICSLNPHGRECSQAKRHAVRTGVLDADVNMRKAQAEQAYRYGMQGPGTNCNVFQNRYEIQSCKWGQREYRRRVREYRREERRRQREYNRYNGRY